MFELQVGLNQVCGVYDHAVVDEQTKLELRVPSQGSIPMGGPTVTSCVLKMSSPSPMPMNGESSLNLGNVNRCIGMMSSAMMEVPRRSGPRLRTCPLRCSN